MAQSAIRFAAPHARRGRRWRARQACRRFRFQTAPSRRPSARSRRQDAGCGRTPDTSVIAGWTLSARSRSTTASAIRQRLLRKRGERLRLAKEKGDVGQDIAKKVIDLLRLFFEQVDVFGYPADLVQRHAPMQSPLDGGPLVVCEIDAARGAQQRVDSLKLRLGGTRLGGWDRAGNQSQFRASGESQVAG
jgi:hypothetical protein